MPSKMTHQARCRALQNRADDPGSALIGQACTRKTKGAGSRKAGLALAYKLATAAEKRWRKVRAPHLVALVGAGATFRDGRLVTKRAELSDRSADANPRIAA